MSDKSPVACLRVQMAPPICLFNTEGMWRMHCANSLPHPPIHHALPFLQTPFWPRPRCQGRHSSHRSLLSAITQVWQGHLTNFSWHGIIVTSLCNYPPLLASTTKVLTRSLLFLPSFWDVFSKVTSLYSIFADFRSLSRLVSLLWTAAFVWSHKSWLHHVDQLGIHHFNNSHDDCHIQRTLKKSLAFFCIFVCQWWVKWGCLRQSVRQIQVIVSVQSGTVAS